MLIVVSCVVCVVWLMIVLLGVWRVFVVCLLFVVLYSWLVCSRLLPLNVVTFLLFGSWCLLFVCLLFVCLLVVVSCLVYVVCCALCVLLFVLSLYVIWCVLFGVCCVLLLCWLLFDVCHSWFVYCCSLIVVRRLKRFDSCSLVVPCFSWLL